MKHMTVGDVMTKDVVSVRTSASFRQIAAAMLTRKVGALPVVDSTNRVIGLVSRTDLVAKEIAAEGGAHRAWQHLSAHGRDVHARAGATTAAGLMSAPVVTVEPGATIARAAYLMRRHECTHLPVVDAGGTLLGIVSRGDLLSAFLRDDVEIREDVVRKVLVEGIDADPDSLEVVVHDGVVTLSGPLDYASTAAYAIRMTRSVPGVVDVVDHLNARAEDPVPSGPLF
jgi:CBS-domain-containing membrane protein